MSEELLQRNLVKNPEKIGRWDFYNIGATTVKALKEYGIIRNVNYGDVEKKKVDGLIVQKKNVIAVIEYKKPSEFKTAEQKGKAIKQEIEVAQKLGAKIFIATDTKETVWVNALTEKRIRDWDGNEIKTQFDPKSEKVAELIEKIHDSINEQNDNIKPRQLINPTDLAKSIWQDIWSVSGATPENCLYTFVELFIFKYLSDLEVLKGTHNFYTLMGMYEANTEDEVLEHYADTIRKKIKELFPENPADKTTIINGTIFVSKDQKAVAGYSTTFKTVLDKFNKYGKLEHIDKDFKSQLFESFLKESISKKNWGQFFTPLKVVRSIVEMAKDEIKDGAKICDPACGVGKFLLEPLVTKLDHYYDVGKSGITRKVTIHGFDKGFDKDEQKTIILAKANMLIYFSDLIKDNPGLTKEFAQLFNDSFTLKTNSILGTLSDPVENEYDLILTNPPYVTSGSGNLKDEIKKDGDLINYYKINAMGVEGLFMEWIIRALKPGGKAFVVVPDGILNRQNDKNLRKFILDECNIDGLISLPLNTFFTTNKKTYILCLTKKENKQKVQTSPVFTYLVSEIGESRNIYRFDIEQNDLHEAVTLYSFFKGNKSEFGKMNTDKRCKIQPIERFIEQIEKDWVIDKWWSEQEKIELGVTEKSEKVTLLEFASIIEDVAGSIQEFQGEVKELSEKKKLKITHKDFPLSQLFDIERGLSKYTKRYGNLHKGEYPVFSASNNAPLTHIDSFDFDGDYLTWAANGFAGYIKNISGRFSINADRGLLKPKIENLNIKYIKYKLEPVLRNLAKGRKGEKGEDEFTKVYPSMLESLSISMPVDSHGKIDIPTQDEAVEKIIFIEEIKQRIEEHKDKIELLSVEIDLAESDSINIPITDKNYFNLQRGKRITKTTIDENKGAISVYSSSKNRDSVLGHISEKYLIQNDLTLYTKPSVLFNLDGSVGYCFLRNDGKYSFIDVVASIMPKSDNIDLEFLLYKLREEILKTGANYQSKLYFNKIKNYGVSVRIPTNSEGKPDLQAQKEIAQKYRKVEEIKESINKELEKILELQIEI